MEIKNNCVFIAHYNIDRQKWDDCIDRSSNGTICLYSWFLDLISPQWSALIMDDYAFVMPLPVRNKFGFSVILQPLFIQQLGIYGAETVESLILQQFIDKIPSNIRLVDYHFNYLNSFTDRHFFEYLPNLVLSLNKSYDGLYTGYSSNLKRKLKKASEADLVLSKYGDCHQVISLFKRFNKKTKGTISEQWYTRLLRVIDESISRGMAEVWIAKNTDDKLLAGIILLKSPNHKRVILNLIAQSETGRLQHAVTWLIDQFIQDRAGTDLILDFEGSKHEGVARFYKSFGSVLEFYPRYHKIRFPLTFLKLIRFSD
jgi:hypothetical protein